MEDKKDALVEAEVATEFEENNPGFAAVQAAAKAEDGKGLSTEQHVDALEWFLSDDPEEMIAHRKLNINVSTDPDKVIFVEWTVQALSRERINQIREDARKSAVGRRRARRDDDSGDTSLANLKIAAEGTLYPDLRDPKVRGQFADPADALKYRFRNKPGIIDQLAAHVIEVTGYDDEDVQEIEAVKN
jgi:hypothetical protein